LGLLFQRFQIQAHQRAFIFFHVWQMGLGQVVEVDMVNYLPIPRANAAKSDILQGDD
jgi:hypothetical protein